MARSKAARAAFVLARFVLKDQGIIEIPILQSRLCSKFLLPRKVPPLPEEGQCDKFQNDNTKRRTPMSNVESFKIELEQEDDGRWIGEIAALSGVIAYVSTREYALVAVQALALRVLADRLDHGEVAPDELMNVSFVGA